MLVEFDFLFIALLLIAAGFVNSFPFRIIISILIASICYFKYQKKERIVALIIVSIFLAVSIPINTYQVKNARIIKIKSSYYLASDGFKNVIIYSKESLNYNDEIKITGDIAKISSYNNFDLSTFESYCFGNNIIGSIEDGDFKVIKSHFSIRKLIYNYNVKNGNNWMNAMIFSDSQLFENDYSSLFFSCGLHVSIFLTFFKQFLSLFMYKRKSSFITNIFASVLLLMIGPSYAMVRIVTNNWLNYFIKDRRLAISLLIIFLCCFKPYYILSLSFMIPIGLKLISFFYKRRDFFAGKFYLSCIQLLFFGSCNLAQVFLFDFVGFVSTLLFTLSISLFVLPLKIDLSFLLEIFNNLLVKIPKVEINGKIPFVLFILSLALIMVNSYSNKRVYYLYYCLLLILNCNLRYLTPSYSVTFLDVGQGDCALLTKPFSKHALLIDSGGNYYKDIANDIVIPYLKAMGVKSIDVIISHDDLDHNGALNELINNFNTNKIITSKQFKYEIDGFNIYELLYDFEYDNNNDNSLTCYLTLNKFSFLFTGDISSNAENDLIKKYNNLDIDVLKLAHHGSKYSSSDNFIEVIKPEFAIISASRNNVYHHPDISVINRLDNFRITYFNTASSGGVKMLIFNHLLFVKTSDKQLIIEYK